VSERSGDHTDMTGRGVKRQHAGPNRPVVFVRVVRFTNVSAERIEGLLARIQQSDGPPPGVPTTGLRFLVDEAQGTAVSFQYFATAEDMAAGAEVLSAMDSGETPGTRVSVDTCEIKLERDFG
jgi:hypothetical protein